MWCTSSAIMNENLAPSSGALMYAESYVETVTADRVLSPPPSTPALMLSSFSILLRHCSNRSSVGTITRAGSFTSSIVLIAITVFPAPVGRTMVPLLPDLSQELSAFFWYPLSLTVEAHSRCGH